AERDAGDEPLVLTDGTAQADGDFLAVALQQQAIGLEVALAQIRRGVVERDRAVLLEMDDRPLAGGAVQREPRDLPLGQRVSEGAPAVGLLAAARERALAADARAV